MTSSNTLVMTDNVRTLTSLASLLSLLSMPCARRLMLSVSKVAKVSDFQLSQLDCHSATNSQITSRWSRSCRGMDNIQKLMTARRTTKHSEI